MIYVYKKYRNVINLRSSALFVCGECSGGGGDDGEKILWARWLLRALAAVSNFYMFFSGGVTHILPTDRAHIKKL